MARIRSSGSDAPRRAEELLALARRRGDQIRRRRRTARAGVGVVGAAVIAAVLAVTVPGGPSRQTVSVTSPTTTRSQEGACTRQGVVATPGASSRLGLDASGAPAPLWSAEAGTEAVTDGPDFVTVTPAGCVVALDAGTGQEEWSWHPPGKATAAGMTAGSGIVVVALSVTLGHPPALTYATVDGLVGLDAATGQERWSRSLADDGQALPMPAVVAGSDVVVSEADGAVIGLDAATGQERWADPRPSGCAPSSSASDAEALSPVAAVLPGGPVAAVSYQCAGSSEVVGYDAATGARRWAWQVPSGWGVEYQTPVGVASGVIGLVVAPGSGSVAPKRTAWPYGPGPQYGPYDLVAVDEATGEPLWELDGVPDSASVYGGAGQLCATSGFGVECLDATSGQVTWQWQPVDVPAHGGAAGPAPGVVASGGRLYLVAPTDAARQIDSGSTTQRVPPGAFDLRVVDMATGQVVDDQPLPSYYRGPGGVVVSVDSPPGVLAVGAGAVVVSPQVQETFVVEAFGVTTTTALPPIPFSALPTPPCPAGYSEEGANPATNLCVPYAYLPGGTAADPNDDTSCPAGSSLTMGPALCVSNAGPTGRSKEIVAPVPSS